MSSSATETFSTDLNVDSYEPRNWKWIGVDYHVTGATEIEREEPRRAYARPNLSKAPEESEVKQSGLTSAREATEPVVAEELKPNPVRSSTLSPHAAKILRHHYVQKIVDVLALLAAKARTPGASRYACDLIEVLDLYIEAAGGDPFVEVALTFYPWLTSQNHWATWSADEFMAIRKVFADFGNRTVNPNMVEKAILQLEDAAGESALGFEISPKEDATY